MKIKIIDLLNKWANGEKMPKTIRWYDKFYNDYDEIKGDYTMFIYERLENKTWNLNDEVEIIEEEPTIEKLEDRIENALEFLETQHGTYPSGKMWRKALMNILQGKSADDVYEPFIEENKKIEYPILHKTAPQEITGDEMPNWRYLIDCNFEHLNKTIYQLIDEINKLKEEKNDKMEM